MKSILIAAFLILMSGPVYAQQTIGGVVAPDAITLRITKVTVVDVPEHQVIGKTIDAMSDPNKIFESSHGYTIVAESKDMRYTMSCVVVYRTESWAAADKITETQFTDGISEQWTQTSLSGQIKSPVDISQRCDRFRVGQAVTFFSSDELIWLSETDSKSVFTHGKCWEPRYFSGRFDTFVCTQKPTPEEIKSNQEYQESINKLTGSTYTIGKPRTLVHVEKPYSIDSEEEKPAKKVAGAR